MKNFILIFLIASSTIVCAQKKATAKAPVANGKLTGIVTYETKAGMMPDADAEIIVHRSDVAMQSPKDTIGRFITVKLLKKIYGLTKDDQYMQQLKQANAETSEKFDVIDRATVSYFFRIMKNPKSIVLKADANGNYSANLKPGRYEVIFRSKGSPDVESIMEINGQINNYYIDIKPGVTETYNQRFKKP